MSDSNDVNLDFERKDRTGFPEIIYCENKSVEQIARSIRQLTGKKQSAMGTRLSREKAESLKDVFDDFIYNETSEIFVVGGFPEPDKAGKPLIVTAGTSDEKVARECLEVLKFFGFEAELISDCGVAGVHRLLAHKQKIEDADVIIAVAGMEGALPGVVAGLTKSPVIGVPTSVGYGVSLQGLTTLFTMLTACAGGIGVVNIDNGYGAAVLAAKILSLKQGN